MMRVAQIFAIYLFNMSFIARRRDCILKFQLSSLNYDFRGAKKMKNIKGDLRGSMWNKFKWKEPFPRLFKRVTHVYLCDEGDSYIKIGDAKFHCKLTDFNHSTKPMKDERCNEEHSDKPECPYVTKEYRSFGVKYQRILLYDKDCNDEEISKYFYWPMQIAVKKEEWVYPEAQFIFLFKNQDPKLIYGQKSFNRGYLEYFDADGNKNDLFERINLQITTADEDNLSESGRKKDNNARKGSKGAANNTNSVANTGQNSDMDPSSLHDSNQESSSSNNNSMTSIKKRKLLLV